MQTQTNNRRLISLLLLTAAFVGCTLVAGSAHAANLTWDAGGGGGAITNGGGAWLGVGLWNNAGAAATWTSGDDATFGGPATAGGAVTLASATIVNSLTINSAFTGTYTLGTALQTITLNSGITKNAGSGAVSIISPITLGGAQTWTNNSTTALTTSNGTNLINNGGFQLTVDGTGSTTFGVLNNAANTLIGSGALVKNGTGKLFIGGDNDEAGEFTGNVTINGGDLHYGDFPGSLGTGNILITNGILESRWTTGFTKTQGSGAGQIQITGGESGFAMNGNNGVTFNIGAITWGSATFNPTKFLLQNSASQINANVTIASAINLNGADRTIVVNGGTTGAARAILSGAISNSVGTAGLIKEGAGMLNLTNNASAWNGTTTVSAGVLDMGGINLAVIGGGAGRNISVANGAGVRFNALSNAILNRIVETTNEIGVMTGTTANNFDFSSSTGADLPNAFLGNWASNGAKAEISGIITPGSDGYKFGARGSSGLLGIVSALTGANDLTVGQTGSSGIRVNLVAANTHTGETVINTGSKLTLGNNLALQNSVLNVGAAGGNFALAAGTNAGRITGETETASPTFGGLMGSRNLSSVFTTAAGNNETNLTANLITGFTLNVGTGNTFTYSGAIGGFGTGTSNNSGGGINGNSTLIKTGAGTQILAGINTYTGVTNIDDGTLLINGSLSVGGGDVNINSGGTLGGIGTINRNVNLFSGGTHAVGNSIGSQTVLTETWNGGGIFEVEFNNFSGVAGTNWDLLNVAGQLTVNASNVNPVVIKLISLNPLTDNFDPALNFTDLLIANADSLGGFDPSNFTFDTSMFGHDDLMDGTFSVSTDENGEVFLSFQSAAAVPEPASLAIWSLLGLGLAGFGVSQIRRRR